MNVLSEQVLIAKKMLSKLKVEDLMVKSAFEKALEKNKEKIKGICKDNFKLKAIGR